jgi:hypothetical protein
MAGIVVGYLVAQALNYPRIAGLIGGLVLGAGIGFLAQKAYLSATRPPDDDGS